jgi:hypothetical protein
MGHFEPVFHVFIRVDGELWHIKVGVGGCFFASLRLPIRFVANHAE